MKKIFKFLFGILMLVIIVGIIVAGVIGYDGYKLYTDAINKVSLQDKVDEIRNKKGYVTLDNIPLDYQHAVLAVEDHRFEHHFGIDFIATSRAILTNIQQFDLAEGGSTITQQLAKNMYFTQEKKFTRKVAELFVALKLEKEYSKNEILEMYLNIIYFGDGYYGVGNGAMGYFEKKPSELNLDEITLLAGIPNAPSVYSPTVNPELAKKRQNIVIDKMVAYNYLTKEQADELKNK